jgi:hypothetical protein
VQLETELCNGDAAQSGFARRDVDRSSTVAGNIGFLSHDDGQATDARASKMNTTGLAQSERGDAVANERASECDTNCNDAQQANTGKNTAQQSFDVDRNADTDAISAGNRWEGTASC